MHRIKIKKKVSFRFQSQFPFIRVKCLLFIFFFIIFGRFYLYKVAVKTGNAMQRIFKNKKKINMNEDIFVQFVE